MVIKLYKNNNFIIFYMFVKKILSRPNTPNFYSNEMIITRKDLNENQFKYTYQKQLISDLDSKHKEWSKSVGD